MELFKTLSDDIWELWLKEYLQKYQQRAKWQAPQRDFKVNDLALLKEESVNRRHWPLVRVVRTYPGKDGRVRVVDVRMPDPHLKTDKEPCRRSILNRPISKLVLLVPAKDTPAPASLPPPGGCSGPRTSIHCAGLRAGPEGTLKHLSFPCLVHFRFPPILPISDPRMP